ncbi:MAG: hypothetical protein WCP63_06050, partial [Cyanobium sp. ELA712]
ILTHLNWGASYLVHDFYRRFISPNANEKHYVNVGRVCTVGLYAVAALLSLLLNSSQDGFEVLISIGAGTGLLYLLRWFWWRINAWCEVVAMVSSFTVSVVFFIMKKTGHALPFANTVLYSVAFTSICWLVTAFLGSPTSRERLIAFYKKVHPAGPGWTKIRQEAGVSEAEAALHGDQREAPGLKDAEQLPQLAGVQGPGAALQGQWTPHLGPARQAITDLIKRSHRILGGGKAQAVGGGSLRRRDQFGGHGGAPDRRETRET